VRLPKGATAGDVVATYDAGVLVVSVPMAQTAAEPIRVPVQGAESRAS
jgi:HSP20 family molecular chaperone IbpA